MLMMIFNAPVDKLHDKKMISFYLTIFIYFVFIWVEGWFDGCRHLPIEGLGRVRVTVFSSPKSNTFFHGETTV